MPVRLAEIIARFGGTIGGPADLLVGADNTPINGIAPLEQARSGDLAFLANPKYRQQLSATQASVVIMSTPADDCRALTILVPQPYLYFAQVAAWMHPMAPVVPGSHASAIIEGEVEAGASIGANVWVGRGARIETGAVVGANCSIGEGACIGSDTRLFANVTIYANCVIGARTTIHSGVVIGGDGFGYARESDGSWLKIPQIGRVVIGDDVEIGAGTTIDRGAMADTVIEDGVKLDNQIQVAHNVQIGAHTAIAGCAGIAGSTVIGKRCTIAGAAMVAGHLKICDDVNISAGTLVAKSITQAGTYTGGVPFLEHSNWLKNFSRLRHLEAMADKIRSLEQRLAELERKST
jgi:UDP-3-O-[3-hydroxymyristoyl] glucosamine N-acyltransferase